MSNETTARAKPPPIRVGVEGIEPRKQAPGVGAQIDWPRLVELPAFQMYAVERSGKSPIDVMAWLGDFLQFEVGQMGEQSLFDHYCRWHTEKGYWPNETPFGELSVEQDR